jgi:hypothetical protein
MRTSLGTRYVAWLRVYEPLDAFPEPERTRWRRYVEAEHPDVAALEAKEHAESLVAAASLPPRVLPADSGDAFVLQIAGIPLVCPREPRLRTFLALRALAMDLPEQLLRSFWPGTDVDAIDDDYQDWRRTHGERPPHLVSSNWHVPPRWFCAFSPADREVAFGSDDGDEQGSPRSLAYRTPMVDARRRVARVVKTLRSTWEEGPVVDDVVALGRWLEEFHPLAWIELDYGGLVHLMDDDAMAADTSAEDVADAVAALDRGDLDASAQAYGRLMERWVDLQRREHLS